MVRPGTLYIAAAIVAVLITRGTAQQFQSCHDAANCGGNVVTATNASDCCLGDGLSFQISGQCFQCIVHGFERTVVSVDEGAMQATLRVSLDIKGNTLAEPANFRVSIIELTLMCQDVTTESDDYSTTACGTLIELDREDPAQLTSEVLITFPADNNALEGTEVLSLRLENTQSEVISAGNIFFQDTSIQIRDTTVLRSGFEEQDYTGREGPDRRSILPGIPCTVTIRLQGTTIEDDLTFRLTPRTVPENTNMNGPQPTGELRGANASRMDFNDTQPFEVTMAAGTEAVTASIGIVDDEINEAAEDFVVVLEVVSNTTNPVEFTIQTTICRIPGNDPIEIGFTQARIEHNETQRQFTTLLEKDRQSEQTFVVRIQISTPSIRGVGEPATPERTSPQDPANPLADFTLGNVLVVLVRLTPEDSGTVLLYTIFEDNSPENTEIFQLSADPDPDTPNNPDFDCDDDPMFQFNGRDCFPDLQVLILDDDIVVIGFVETLVEVNESDGQATLNVTISFPEPDPVLPFEIMFRLDATMMSITAGARPASADRFDPVIPGLHDYQEIAPGSVLPRNFEDTRRTQTFNVPIYDDNVTEGVEEFNITLSLQDPRLSDTVIVRPAVATVRIRDNDVATTQPPTTQPPTTQPPTTQPPTTRPPTTQPPTTQPPTTRPPTTQPPTQPFIRVNDTVTGDPLMTVPLNVGDSTRMLLGLGEGEHVSLCYEVHGEADENFNLVSDVCVSVNAHYMRVRSDVDINIIDTIGVRAVGNDNQCRNIQVDLNGCRASVDGVEITMPYRMAGISVRKYTNRVRIAVPNCEDHDLVMWVFCLTNTFTSGTLTFQAPMIRFVIARGLNLQETSHGIIGQFWNIPIDVVRYNQSFGGAVRSDTYTITVNYPNQRRQFVGLLHPLTWELDFRQCLYVGNRQGGPIDEVSDPNDPVLQGEYTNYRVNDLHGTNFAFAHFESSRCSTPTAPPLATPA